MLTFDTTLGHFLCRLQNQSLSLFVFLSFSPILVAGFYLWWFKLHFSSFRTHLDVASWVGGGSGVEMRDSEHWKTRAPFHLLPLPWTHHTETCTVSQRLTVKTSVNSLNVQPQSVLGIRSWVFGMKACVRSLSRKILLWTGMQTHYQYSWIMIWTDTLTLSVQMNHNTDRHTNTHASWYRQTRKHYISTHPTYYKYSTNEMSIKTPWRCRKDPNDINLNYGYTSVIVHLMCKLYSTAEFCIYRCKCALCWNKKDSANDKCWTCSRISVVGHTDELSQLW